MPMVKDESDGVFAVSALLKTNYTHTYFSEHVVDTSHNTINRYLIQDKLAPSLVWGMLRKIWF